MIFTALEILVLLVVGFIGGFLYAWWLRGILFKNEVENIASDQLLDGVEYSNHKPSKISPVPKKAIPKKSVLGKKDDLKAIKGVGVKIEKTLNKLGIFHFHQIAALQPEHAENINAKINFPGRIKREKWIEQAQQLEASNSSEFSRAEP